MTKATSDNQPLFELGDAFEIFLQREGATDYVELHVAPNGKRMHLSLPGLRGRPSPGAEALAFGQMLVTPVGFSATTAMADEGWRAEVRIPAATLGLKDFRGGERFRISFCRYDASGEGPPICSSSSPHKILDFHRPDEWTQIVLAR